MLMWGRGGIGIRRGLKILGREACGFESRRPYQSHTYQPHTYQHTPLSRSFTSPLKSFLQKTQAA